MIISRESSPLHIMIDQKQLDDVEYFNYSSSLITNDTRCKREIQFSIAMAKAVCNRKETFFARKLNLNLRKKLVKFCIWSTALYGAETGTFREVDQKHLESFEMWCWRRMEKIRWTDRVRNEEALHRVKEDKSILRNMKIRKVN